MIEVGIKFKRIQKMYTFRQEFELDIEFDFMWYEDRIRFVDRSVKSIQIYAEMYIYQVSLIWAPTLKASNLQ